MAFRSSPPPLRHSAELPQTTAVATTSALSPHSAETPSNTQIRPTDAPQVILGVSKPLRLPTTAPSSSNGETVLLHSSHAADSTVNTMRDVHRTEELPAFAFHAAAVADCITIASIELSPSPSADDSFIVLNSEDDPDAVNESTIEEQEEAVSLPAITAVHSNVGLEVRENGSSADTPLLKPQEVWTRHVHVASPFASPYRTTTTPGGGATLSEAAANVIAHALHRASLLRRCLDTWQQRQSQQQQRRQHHERFARSYNEYNLRYLMFRAWQWRCEHRRRQRELKEKVVELRRRLLCRQALHRWRAWQLRERLGRQHVQMLLLKTRAKLRESVFARWRQWSSRSVQCNALTASTLQEMRRRFFKQWCATALERKRRRLVVQVVALHTPAAWAGAEVEQGRLHHSPLLLLLLRYSWVQWLRVTMQRRACRLHRFTAHTQVLQQHTTQAHRQRRYTAWLQVTFAKLQGRQVQRAFMLRYVQRWRRVGCLCLEAKRWTREVQEPRTLQRCCAHWRERCEARARQRSMAALADVFIHAAMKVHAARCAFQQWRQRWCSRQRKARMRRVAEDYARPALLRHLFLRHVTDGVFSSLVEPSFDVDVDESARHRTEDDNTMDQVTKAAADMPCVMLNKGDSLDVKKSGINGDPEQSVRNSTLTKLLPAMQPPIPLHPASRTCQQQQQQQTPERLFAKDPKTSHEGGRGLRCVITDKATEAATQTELQPPPLHAATETTQSTPAPLPPPPTYDEAMRCTTQTSKLPSATLSSARADVGVSTELEDITATDRGAADANAEEWRASQSRGLLNTAAPLNALPVQPVAASAAAPSAAVAGELWLVAAPPPHSPALCNAMPLVAYPTHFDSPLQMSHQHAKGRDGGGERVRSVAAALCSVQVVTLTQPLAAPPVTPEHGTERNNTVTQWESHVTQSVKDAAPLCRKAFHKAGNVRDCISSPASPSQTQKDFHTLRSGDSDDSSARGRTSLNSSRSRSVRSCCRCADVPAGTPRRANSPLTDLRAAKNTLPPSIHQDVDAQESAVHGAPSELSFFAQGRVRRNTEAATRQNSASVTTASSNTTTPGDSAVLNETQIEQSGVLVREMRDGLQCKEPQATLSVVNGAESNAQLTSLSALDVAALRLTARSLLDDYKHRTRLLTSEKAELATVQSRLALEKQLGLATAASEARLRERQRYLQTRLLEWQEKRAQVARVTALLEERVRSRSSAAASQTAED